MAVVCLVALISATYSAAQQDQGNTPITRPVISEDVIPLRVITPIARDGHRGEGFLRKPPGKGPFPAVLLIHGGLPRRPTEVIRQYTLSTHPSRFLEVGYVIAVITYRGRDIDPTAQTALSVQDCVAAVDYAKGLPYVDPDSVFVTGTSGGGDLTLEVAAATEVAAIVPEEPASMLMAGLVVDNSRAARSADYIQLYRTNSDHQRLTGKIARISSPILVVQGDSDTHSGLNRFNAAVLFPELRAAGKSLEVITYPGEPHSFSFESTPSRTPRPAVALKAFRDIDAFMRRHVATQPQPIEPSRVQHVPVGSG